MPKPYIIAKSGAFLRNPRGGVEGVAEMKAAGITWLTLNIGDGQSWAEWYTVITRAKALGMGVFPWARCRTLAECRLLLEAADLVGNRGILNIEDEFERAPGGGPAPCAPDKVREVIDEYPGVAVSFSTGAWLMNAVDYTPIAHRPVLLQLFPTDMNRSPTELPQLEIDCRAHARAKGFRYIGITCQTYATAQPSWYAYMGTRPRSLYTGDDIGAGNWAAWA